MNILDQIVAQKKKEVEEHKAIYPVRLLESSIYFSGTPVSLKKYVKRPDKSGIIAEIKRKSPSRGLLNPDVSVERISIGYMQAGASALSVLTDNLFFGGSNADLTLARKFNFCPILRKDFVIDEYQILEAKSIGADAILLIAAILTPAECKQLASFAHGLGLEVLLEVHDEGELMRSLDAGADLIGVNNRNLKTFEVSIDVSKRLSPLMPAGTIRISESGISDRETIAELKRHGYDGFLIGETFMKSNRPEEAARAFIDSLKES